MSSSMLSPEAALAVVEAAYQLDGAHDVWLSALTSAFVAAIEGGYGGAAHAVDAALLELCRDRPGLLTGTELEPNEALGRELAGVDHDIARDHEQLFLIASDGYGGGWLLGAVAPCAPRLSISQRERWRRVAAHVAAAGELRCALAAAFPSTDGVTSGQRLTSRLRDAIVTELRSGAINTERMPIEPGAAWSALATGHWSLVDLFETQGRCVVVARPNMADAADPRALTLRERDVAERAALGRSGKEIAYELGLRTPTVSQLLHNAVRKLGAAGVAQLGTVVRGLGQLGFDRGRSS
jgi:DNA-binding CsgD family transcriptional regulator